MHLPNQSDLDCPAVTGAARILDDMVPDLPRKAMFGALDGMGQGLLVLNSRQKVVLINRSAKLLLKLDTTDVEGLPLRDVLATSPVLDSDLADALAARCVTSRLVEEDFPLPIGPDNTPTFARIRKLAGRHRAIFLDPVISLGRSAGDDLTGLLDRRGFLDNLHTVLERRRSGAAVLCVDLGRFRWVNDTLGHAVGDKLLQHVAGRIQSTLRRQDVAARLASDEFAILAAVDDRLQDAQALGRRLAELLSRPYSIDGHSIHMDARVGLALAPDHGGAPDLLLRRALLALRQAKYENSDVRLFDPTIQSRADARRILEADLRKALELQQFELHYQPLINLSRGAISGFEALIRWRHPTRGLISPNDFIPLAEEIGLISDLGQWVVREACLEAARWPKPISVSVNASSAQFETGQLVPAIMNALADTGLPGTRLEVEVTETALLRKDGAALAVLKELRGMGVRIAMDDFGTGYSSLTQLQSYPFDTLKIDRSFVSRIGESQESTAIVRAIARMGSSLGLRTVAEGVETPEQLAALRAEGCDDVQGFLLSRPVPTNGIAQLLERFPTAPV